MRYASSTSLRAGLSSGSSERMKRTEKATKSKSAKERFVEDEDAGSSLIRLTEEQSKRLWGISHLEGGKDPLIIIDELLDRDSKLRKTYKAFNAEDQAGCGFS